MANGELLADSGEIIDRLSRDHDVDLDDGLTPDQRMTSAQRDQRARADLLAIATLLEPEGLLVGPPCSADATLFSFLWAMSADPFVSPLGDLIAGDPRLTAYIDRMRERYWANWTA